MSVFLLLSHANTTKFPNLANNVDINNELQFYRLTGQNWLTQTMAKVVVLARYWQGSCSLGDVSSSSISIGLLDTE